MLDMSAPHSLLHLDQSRIATGLIDAVVRWDECVRLACGPGADAVALLDQAQAELSTHRLRCVRVHGPMSGGPASGRLALHGLVAQILGQADLDALGDSDLKAGFVALTEPGEGYDRVVLLVTEAHSLQPSAMHYIQLACQAGPKLRVVLAGQPSLAATLARDKFAYLRQRITRTLELPGPTQDEAPAPLSPSRFLQPPQPSSAPAVLRRDGPWRSFKLGALAPLALLLALLAAIGWRHMPAPSMAATHAEAPAPELPTLELPAPELPAPSLPAPNAPAADGQAALAGAESGVPAAAAPAVQPEAAAAAALRTDQPFVAVAPPSQAAPPSQINAPSRADAPKLADTPKSAEPPAAPQERTEATGEQTKQASAPSGAAPGVPASELLGQPVEPAESGAAAHDAPPVSASVERPREPAQDAEAAMHPAAPSDAAQPLRASAAAFGPSVPPQPHTSAVAVPPPEAPQARRARRPAERAATPAAVLPTSSANGRRCRDIVLYVQLGKNLSDADKQFLRDDCRAQ